MNRKTMAGDRRRRKLIAALWALGLATLVIVLIYLEQTAILYILCTLGVTALLVIVAFANLGQHEVHNQEVVQAPRAAKET
jgi:ABC-type lipoprotein release transport system permease subunit